MFQALHCVDTCWFATRATEEAGRRLRSELNIPSHDEVVLFAGKLLPFKRPLDVVDAVAEVAKARSVCLMVAGSGQMESQLIEHAFARGVRLHNLGFCNQSRMPEVYSASRVLVLPSSGSETWGLVCNEAIACGRPIVISDAVGCAPDLASDVAVGRSFPLGDTIGLAAAISATLDTPIAVDRLRRVSKVYSIRATVDGIEEALHALCS
jgi:glycosyltransferase involved in cell wall biosynthesis